MRLSLTLFAGLLAAHTTLAAPFTDEILSQGQQLRQHAMASNRAWNLLESLTTEVGPRLPGTEADRRAVAWAKAKLNTLGFDRVYLEPVTVPHWHRGQASARITTPFPQSMVVTALGNTVGTDPAGVEAEVVAFNTLEDLKQADPEQVMGKIVFINHRMERYKDGRGYSPVVKARGRGAVEAAKKGAVAMLLRSVGTDSHRFAHTGMMRYQEGIAQIPAAALSNPDADQLERLLKRGEPVRFNLKLSSETRREQISYNVVAEITGSTHPEQVVLIGAHLDSWDEGTGALDDGAGVAIVTAAAKHIIERNLKPKRTVRVVLFAAEEIGLIGAKAYKAAHLDRLDSLYIAAEADFGAGPIYRLDSRVNEAALETMDEVARQLAPLGVERGHNHSWGGPDVSILPDEGVPVAGLSMDGSDYFDVHHTMDDTLDKVDPDALRQSSAVYTLYTWLMANAEQSLRPIPLPQE
ncbi:M20/M25/M40 family metallo-hydrolase [Ferrimonas sediminicola]|uniref:Carboxypeptidase Q n=1 Tax=Ferrimonas sediminicola TaxID=2569538 RepID=A0A4U1BDU5_9GAMM|nr:M20/M25/M40 family metallo-hydrolase [Ferrimonas sediminicola]TKB48771.1 M20/M25/M40 family metallo-hydrolase [Ferrimonas sediminicola]